ncbi:MAG: 2-hydroxychromene-2-carboxylate isomerase [Rhodospirillaceae bacterium]|nr:2-hydroxychromene-2-carboxylate isomerase [Rhodospirillaceae bacterium]
MTTVEFFFDYSSPWTYLAFDRIEAFCEKNNAELIWKPFLVGGVFNKVNPSVYQRRENPVPPKDNYYRKDMNDWARYQRITLIKPSVFPLNSVKALRGAFVAIEEGKISDYSRECFKAYWTDDKDISKEEILQPIAEAAGMDGEAFMAKIAEEPIKRKLFETTDEIISREGFGSPTFFINKTDMYFGNDRLELMQAAISPN